MIFIELSKVVGLQPQDSTKLEQWLLFLKSDKETKEALAVESSTMREAFEEIQRFSQCTPVTRAAAISTGNSFERSNSKGTGR